MPKYYIESGELRREIDRPTRKMALIDAFSELDGVNELGLLTSINEIGFDAIHKEDEFMSTIMILDAVDDLQTWQ